MPPDKMKELARRIAERANAGKVVRLTPATALIVAKVLWARATRPMRWKIVAAMCQVPHCKDRRDCYTCIMKANGIEKLYDDEYALIVKGPANE